MPASGVSEASAAFLGAFLTDPVGQYLFAGLIASALRIAAK